MKYYHLTNNISMKEIGCIPHVETFIEYGTIRDFGKYSRINEKFTLPEPVLFSKAKASTYLTGVLNSKSFLTVKSHFVDFLIEYDIGDYQSWNIKVHHRKEVLDTYSVFHLSEPKQEEYVDYSNSDFYFTKRGNQEFKRESIKINNSEHYRNSRIALSEDDYRLHCNCLVFDLSSATEDLFRLTDMPFGHGYYVSERLKLAIEMERFTGMEFMEIEKYSKKVQVIY